MSGGHFFSSWESPSDSRRIPEGCGWNLNWFEIPEVLVRAHFPKSSMATPHITSADLSGSLAPVLQFQKREIHTVFPRFRNFELAQNLSLRFLAELCGVALYYFIRSMKNNVFMLFPFYLSSDKSRSRRKEMAALHCKTLIISPHHGIMQIKYRQGTSKSAHFRKRIGEDA